MTDTDKQKELSNTGNTPVEKRQHPKDPLHGLSLKTIVTELEEHYGWDGLAQKIPVNCFKNDPSLKSSLTFLRKTPWAREKVEQLYIRSKQNWGKYKKP